MTLAPLQREKILLALLEFRKNYGGTQDAFCTAMGINAAAFSQVKRAVKNNLPLDKLISDDKLVILGRRLQVSFSTASPIKVTETETFEYLTSVMQYCQDASIMRIFCDLADIGKTIAAKWYMLNHQNVFYIDCSQCKSRTEFIKAIARAVGVNENDSIPNVFKNTVYMLNCMNKPLVELDEVGDLTYPAWLELKSYWNATEGGCAFLLMGADGLAKKILQNVTAQKVGYAEILRRAGGECLSITGKMNQAEVAQFKKRQAVLIAENNLPKNVRLEDVVKNTMSPTRVAENIRKAERGELLAKVEEAA